MIVQCKNCKTKFRIADNLIPDSGRKVKCSKCGNIFTIFKPVEKPKVEEEEEVFHLTEDEVGESSKKQTKPKKDEADLDIDEKELEEIAKKYSKPSKSKKLKKKRGSRFSFLITMAMLIIAIFLASVYIFVKTKNRVPPFKFYNLQAQYYENTKYKTVLVVKGYVVNNRMTPYTHIKLKAVIFDNTGKKLAEQVSYPGNTFEKDEILNLTPEYVKKFVFNNIVLKPEKKLPFMIFFFNLPKSAYSFQVIIEDYEKVKK